MNPQRITRERTKGWRMPKGAVYVGRPSRWGNPFRIYNGHHLIGPPWGMARATWSHIPKDQAVNAYITSSHAMSNREAVDKFAMLLRVRARDEPDLLREWLAPLAGHDLACWCPVGLPCHADVLIELANGGVR